ncbi:hypothetical protein AVDCRST_MAG81-1575 [uncultured Synechococcales cyanobacterium]|uniref:Uncharacterized protein n=1 Tax=uncultured Synechococcales cyanobacterium TaxID=1936017 RepID=A0A6J4V6V1_9CYAN|nr:hypothetical protein AVDCRST_MAG81-1575 [uncultured Synechococcales cyanobacterium]
MQFACRINIQKDWILSVGSLQVSSPTALEVGIEAILGDLYLGLTDW